MRLFGYYAWHSFVNQLKKIFRTWVIVFLLVCVAGGVGIGLMAGMTASKVEDTQIEKEKANHEENQKEKPTDSFKNVLSASGLHGKQYLYVFTAAGVIILLLFFIGSADAGGKIFLPADVSLIFASPMKPQSVLMMRLFARMGTFVFLTLYVVIMNLELAHVIGMNGFMIAMLVIAWILMFVTAKLIQTVFYLGCEAHPAMKRSLRYIVLGIAVLLSAILYFYTKSSDLPIGTAAYKMLDFRGSFVIPVYGWLKSIVYFAGEGRYFISVFFSILSVIAVIALVYLIYHMKADFYETAISQTEKTAASIEKSNESRYGIAAQQKVKKRKAEVRNEGIGHGWGASVFFFKSMHNRWRSTGHGILTKTSATYIVVTLMAGFFVKGQWSLDPATVSFMVLMAFVFYRSMGNPLGEDTRMGFYRMIPESPWKKLFFSMIAGTVNCCMDILPSLILIAVLFHPSVYLFLMGIALVITMDFYATTVSVFLDSSIPRSVDRMVRQLVQSVFLLFGLVPDIIILVTGYMNDHMMANLPYCVIVNLVVGMIFFAVTPIVMEDMRVRVTKPSIDQFDGDLNAIRKNISRIAFGMVLIIVFSAAAQIAVSAIISRYFKWILDTSWGTWVVAMLPEYLIGFPIGYGFIRKVKPAPYKDRSLSGKNFLMAVPSSFFMTVTGALIGQIVLWFIGLFRNVQTTSAVETMAGQGSVFLRILFMVMLAPLIEEFIFRKTLIDRLRPYGEMTSIFFSALAFGLFHGNFSQMFYAFGIGLIFGTIYEKTGRIRYSLALHMTVNFVGGIIAPMVASGIRADTLITELPVSVIIYAMVYYGFAIIGIVTFFISYARVGFRKQEMELPYGTVAKTVYANPGMIAFFIACAVLVCIQTA